jgi:signal peptidase
MELAREERIILFYSFIILLGIAICYSIISALLRTNKFLVTVTSNSMEPTLKKGDIAIIKNVEDIRVGDIIVFESRGDLYIHRVVGIDQEYYITKGDAYSYPDLGKINRERILGKVVAKIPYLGYLNIFLEGKL